MKEKKLKKEKIIEEKGIDKKDNKTITEEGNIETNKERQ